MEDFLKIIKTKYNPEDQKLIEYALEFAKFYHKDQKRLGSGQPFIIHPVTIAKNLAKLNLDSQTIIAALLHDTIEDGQISEKTIEKEFGKEVAFLVSGVTKLGKLKYQGAERYIENLRKMFLAMAEDLRVVLIKLYDRLNNLETLDVFPVDKQKRIAEETLEIYAPLAYRLGIGEISGQLEDLAFPYVYPQEYQWLMKNVKEKYEEREKYLRKVKSVLQKELKKEGIEILNIHSRAKHYFSLYKKLLRYDMDFDKIYDLVALRIITKSEDVDKCYEILGIIHKLWKPLPGLIKDYIALPKPNGYRSLHTTVFCLEGKITEIQIRTPKMHDEAEYGVAAHWAYVEAGKPKSGVKLDEKKFGWVQELRKWQKEKRDSGDFLESLKIDFFKNRVFVLTPKGDVIDLPEDSTPIDFAYQIHTDLGHKARGAKINGKMAPLDRPLQNWDVVEIITGKEREPKRSWLYFVKTSNAKSKIKNWFKKQSVEENYQQGMEILNKSLLQFKNLTWEKIPKFRKEELFKKLPYKNEKVLVCALGRGEISSNQIIKGLFKEEEIFETLPSQKEFRIKLGRLPIKIGGANNLLISLAKCCSPLPPERIQAFITKSRGAVIHQASCRTLNKISLNSPERLIDANWESLPTPKKNFILPVKILVEDRVGLLKDISSTISNLGINILKLTANASNKEGKASLSLKVEISDIDEAEKLFLALRNIKNIIEVRRDTT